MRKNLQKSYLNLHLFFISWALFHPPAQATLPNEQAVAQAIQIKVEKLTLNNGLTVLLHEDHSSPFFTYQQWFRVGSKNEKVGRTGLAHFFEHLMFAGTTQYPGNSLDRLILAKGGTFNAFTTQDFTAYHMELPSDQLELAFRLESDRLRNLTFLPQKIKSEREVVKEERRLRVDNDFFGLILEKMWPLAFKVHPYQRPVIGSMEDLNQASLEDLQEFYRTYYTPHNAFVVIAGDFDSSRARKLINKYYRQIPSQPVEPMPSITEPTQNGERRLRLVRPVQNTTLMVNFKTTKAYHTDTYPLDLIASILGGDVSSRLYRQLVYRQQSVTAVEASHVSLEDAGVLNVLLSLKPGQDAEKVLASVYAEFYKLRTQLVSDKELEKAKNRIMKEYVDSLKTISGKAYVLMLHEIYFHDYQTMFKDLQNYLSVTKEQIQTVAQKYFQPQMRSIVSLEPHSQNQMTPITTLPSSSSSLQKKSPGSGP